MVLASERGGVKKFLRFLRFFMRIDPACMPSFIQNWSRKLIFLFLLDIDSDPPTFARFYRKIDPKPQIGKNYGGVSVTNRPKYLRNRVKSLEVSVRSLGP